MSMFRKTRISDERLLEILRSLPQAKASADFEQHLGRMIASNNQHVPNLLGSLPLVPAPDDFDARLMEAIRDRRRPVAPIPIAAAAGGASINWLNHIMGWIGGSLAVVTIAFFINHTTGIVPDTASAPVARGHVVAASPAPAAPDRVPVSSMAAPHLAEAAPSAAQSSPVAPVVVEHEAVPGQSAAALQSAPAVHPRYVTTPTPRVTEHITQPSAHPAVLTVPPARVETRTDPVDTTILNAGTEVKAGANSNSTADPDTAVTPDKDDSNASAPQGTVNTGGDTGVDTNKQPR